MVRFGRLALRAVLGLGGMGGIAEAVAAGERPQDRVEAPRGRVFDHASGIGIADAAVTWMAATADVAPAAAPEEAVPAPSLRTNAVGAFAPGDDWGPGDRVSVSALGYVSRDLTWSEAAAVEWRIGLDRDPLALDEIVVTAGAVPRLRSQIAVPVASVEKAEIEASGHAAADRLLRELPGMQAAAAAPVGSTLMIRGIGGARILVLLDGQPTGGALLENRDLSRMSLAGVERVEIVKGPLSSLYGSDALGGVVNIVTKHPEAGVRVNGRASWGGAGRRDATATASGGGRLRYLVTGAWRQEDRVPGIAATGPSAFARVWDARTRLQFRASDRWELRASATYLRERQRWPVGGGFSGFNDNSGLSGWIEARRSGDRGAWSGHAFAQDYAHLYRSARGDAPVADDGESTQRERTAKGAVNYSAALGGHALDFGVEGAARSIRSPDKLVEERVADRQIAVFLQDAWRTGGRSGGGQSDDEPVEGRQSGGGQFDAGMGRTVLSVGARFVHNNQWGSNLSPTVGATHAASDRLRLRIAAGRGFRAPSFKELTWRFVNVGGGYVLQGSPELRSERSWNVSAGATWQLAPRVLVEAESFHNRISDLIEPGFVGHTESGLLIYSPRNVADAVTRGFELSLRSVLTSAEFVIGYAYLDAFAADTGVPLDRRARHSARARATWTPEAQSGLRLDATAHLTGDAPIIAVGDDGRNARVGVQERFVSLDVRAAIDVRSGYKLFVGVDNAFDVRPAGWQSVIERRVRAGLVLEDLLGG